MTASDYQPFVGEFRRLSAALEAFKSSPESLATRADAYFSVLKSFPLADVIRKADRWLQKETKFPKPAEWAGVIVTASKELPVLGTTPAQEHREAKEFAWEAGPCSCAACVEACVSERPLRYVPDDPIRQAIDGGHVVTLGHWAHGFELLRWYEARGAFWNRCYELGLMTPAQQKRAEKLPFEERLLRLFAKVGKLTT